MAIFKKFFLLLAAVALLSQNLFALIIDSDDLQPLREELAYLDSNSLVLFDVDRTLITPTDAILHPNVRGVASRLIAEFLATSKLDYDGEDPKAFFYSKMASKMQFQHVDESAPELIRELLKRGIPTLAFTAMPAEKMGVITSMADWRFAQLQALGYDFRATFPELDYLELATDLCRDPKPLFKEGILYSSTHPKGDILEAFLEALGWKPDRIIFIDDHKHFVSSVERAAEKMGIDFIGIHYNAAHHMPCELDPAVAAYQYRHLGEHGEWLSDSEASAMLEEARAA